MTFLRLMNPRAAALRNLPAGAGLAAAGGWLMALLRGRVWGALAFLLAALAMGQAGAQTNAAVIVAQSVPSTMVQGKSYAVSVTVRNSGSSTWTTEAAYKLGAQNPQDNAQWGFGRVALNTAVAPGQDYTFNFTVTAPAQLGTYHFQWRMLREFVEWFGDFSPDVAVTVTVPPPVDDAAMVTLSVPAQMTAGQTYNASVTVKNTGNTTWPAGGEYRLGSQNPQDNYNWGNNRVLLGSAVAPGQQYTISFQVNAPSQSGSYNFQWRMVREYIAWFGATSANAVVQVSGTAPAAPQLTVTRTPSPMTAGGSYTLSWNSTGASKVSMSCTASGSGYAGTVSRALSGSVTETASAAWVGYPSSCTWTATGAGGSKSIVETMTTVAAAVPDTITYFHNDASGTPLLATAQNGSVVWEENYRPYGERLNNAPAAANNSLWFAGKPVEQASGLSYMGARYYDPFLGRFMAVDPTPADPEKLHSINRYAYANNNPYRFVDPDGHSPIDVVFLVYDIGKLGMAMYTGVGVGAAMVDVGISMVGVGSPIPGTGQAIKAARAGEHAIHAYKAAGAAREAKTGRELVEKFGEAAVQREQYLRTADRKIAKDWMTGEARRVDHVVIVDGKAVTAVETTSMGASKTAQSAKETRIRDAGGTFVRDRNTGDLIDFKDIETILKRLP
ncbi:RHS repeat-associated core domain-containing protein [Massilia sp. erpn]|uniref:RHS repeat-associated core domain-containing protein n=1 Tax=Massilia sp. erpn TaxID=2738142 RepID=UPI002101E6F5|nr:RHS repeat-associated core domain-containing protein [Massilia sp. erpn]UTY55835.1 hypothetical protein HPQ68_00735 [Massilia sp. erpn]